MPDINPLVAKLANAPQSRVVTGKDIACAEGEERCKFLTAFFTAHPAAKVDDTKAGMVAELTVPGVKGSNVHIYADHITLINGFLGDAEGWPLLSSW